VRARVSVRAWARVPACVRPHIRAACERVRPRACVRERVRAPVCVRARARARARACACASACVRACVWASACVRANLPACPPACVRVGERVRVRPPVPACPPTHAPHALADAPWPATWPAKPLGSRYRPV
jgi:hypothetical protein